MCGIAGIINFTSHEDKERLLRDMVGLLGHRGPDAAGMLLGGATGLAQARLSIIDLEGGDQPMCNEDRTVWVVFNGEIFNYPELRSRLISKGHKFSTTSDTEVLVHLYEDLGPDLVSELNGQFAFAIWDASRQRVCLGRDRMGIRPLFYTVQGGRLAFASEIKALFADPSLHRRLDLQTLSDVFTCWSPEGETTPFEGVSQLPPAHVATFDQSGLSKHAYWQVPFLEPGLALAESDRILEDWVGEFTELLTDAARIRLRADVPVGAYLSGGIDSTFISSLVCTNFNNELRTFSVCFSDATFDETPYQQQALSRLGIRHESICCTANDIGEIFPDVVWHTETPILRTAPAPLQMLSGLVRDNGFKVVLTGEGADEMFAGYNIFKEDRIRRFWARNPESQIRPGLLKRLYPYIFNQENERAAHFTKVFFKRGLTDTNNPVYSHLLRWSNTSQLSSFFSEQVSQCSSGLDAFVGRIAGQLPQGFMDLSSLSRAQYLEISLFLSNYLLSSQGDRMAMANSVEGRYPFLDHRVVEFAARVPPRYRLNGLKEKFILKKAAKGLLPDELITRAKQPYRAPISSCFFGDGAPDYVDELLSEEAIRKSGTFDPGKVSRLVDKCRKQQANLTSERENMAVVGILSTQLLDHQFIQNSPAERSVPRDDIKVHRVERTLEPARN